MVAIAIKGDDLFSARLLNAIRRITYRIEKIKNVDAVYSLSNSRYIQATEDRLDVNEFLNEMPQNSDESEDLKNKAMGYNLFKGRMVSSDGKTVAIIVQIADVIGKKNDLD